MMDNERYSRIFESVSETCPWNKQGKCKPQNFKLNVNYLDEQDCSEKKCPIQHFIKFYNRREVRFE